MQKTAKQVREWLEAQPWYEAFKTNTSRRFWYDAKTVQNVLNGVFLEATIMAAFDWDYSKEGSAYWEERQDEFMDWYRTQTLF